MKCNEEQIKKTLKDYIKKDYCDYAILIDGQWGSGKTFFMKNNIIPMIENEINKKALYISTYGMQSTKEIDKKIYFEIINSNVPEKKGIDLIKKGGKVIISGAKILTDILKLPSTSYENISSFLSMFQRLENYTIIFDDIERCQIPINELLGYLNNYTEHRNIKVIIVANEAEIIKNNLSSDLESKYQVALNEKIEYKEDDNTAKGIAQYFNQRDGNKSNENKQLDKKDLEKRVEYLFGEDKKYKQIREKLIGNTVYYIPDIPKVSKKLITTYIKDNDVAEKITNEIEFITNIIERYNHPNIRTLKMALEKFNCILECIQNKDITRNEKYYNTLILIFNNTLYSMIKYKKGENLEQWNNECEYADIVDNFYNTIKAFRFVDDLVLYSVFDEERIKKVILDYMNKVDIPIDENDALKRLNTYWELEDEDINGCIEELKEKLSENKYQVELYPEIIMKLVKIRRMGFTSLNINEYIEKMENNITNVDREIDFSEYHVMASNQEELDEYNKYAKILKELAINKEEERKQNSINSILEYKDGWGYSFYEYWSSRKDRFLLSRAFFSLIDIPLLLDTIQKSKSIDIGYFRRIVYSIYNFENIREFYKQDIPNLLEFATGLREQKTTNSITQKYNQELLLENIEDVIRRLNN